MSLRDWLSDAAARGLLILALCGAAVAAVAQAPGPPNSRSVGQQATQDRGAPLEVPQPLLVRVVPEQEEKAPDPEKPCEQSPNRDWRDLCQQWRMANAAEKQLDLLTQQNDITATGNALLADQNDLLAFQNKLIALEAILLFLAFGASAIATLLTGLQIRETRREFVATHRPRIQVKHVWLSGKILAGTPIMIDLVLVNAGANEALFHSVTFKSVTLPVGQRLPPHFLRDQPSQTVHELPLGPGITTAIFGYKIHGDVSPEDLFAITTGAKDLYMVGAIEYLDGEKRFRNTTFCRVLKLSETEGHRFYRPEKPDPDYEYEH